MVSHVHYPDFKGGGETLYTLPKIAAVIVFVGIIFLGRESVLFAILTAVFSTYAIFGILNSLYALFHKS